MAKQTKMDIVLRRRIEFLQELLGRPLAAEDIKDIDMRKWQPPNET